jgi:hypothetical protein
MARAQAGGLAAKLPQAHRSAVARNSAGDTGFCASSIGGGSMVSSTASALSSMAWLMRKTLALRRDDALEISVM